MLKKLQIKSISYFHCHFSIHSIVYVRTSCSLTPLYRYVHSLREFNFFGSSKSWSCLMISVIVGGNDIVRYVYTSEKFYSPPVLYTSSWEVCVRTSLAIPTRIKFLWIIKRPLVGIDSEISTYMYMYIVHTSEKLHPPDQYSNYIHTYVHVYIYTYIYMYVYASC